MNIIVPDQTFTYSEYLKSELEIEHPYELVAGKIIEMPPESPSNVAIALYLMFLIAQQVGIKQVSNKAEIIVSGSRVTARVPDVTVFSDEGAIAFYQQQRSTVDLDMLPPVLVIEVVSPGKTNRDRDYRYKRCSAVLGVSSMSDCIKKRSEYAARGIEYYWIIDPQEQKFVCLTLVDGLYEEQVYFYRDTQILSISQPIDLEIDLNQIFAA